MGSFSSWYSRVTGLPEYDPRDADQGLHEIPAPIPMPNEQAYPPAPAPPPTAPAPVVAPQPTPGAVPPPVYADPTITDPNYTNSPPQTPYQPPAVDPVQNALQLLNADEGPREATPGSVGSLPLPDNIRQNPTTSDTSYTLQDGRTTPPSTGGNWEPLTNLTQPQRPAVADAGQWLAEDSQSTPPVSIAEQNRARRIVQPDEQPLILGDGSTPPPTGYQPPPVTDAEALERSGPVGRAIDAGSTMVGDAYTRAREINPSLPPINPAGMQAAVTSPEARTLLTTDQPDTPEELWTWRGKVAKGAADAIAHGLGENPDQVIVGVEINGVPVQMTVSDLLQNFTDPLLAAGWGVGDIVLDAAGRKAMQVALPFLRGVARETVGRLLTSEPAQAAGRAVRNAAEGTAREVVGGLIDAAPSPRVIGDAGEGIGRAMLSDPPPPQSASSVSFEDFTRAADTPESRAALEAAIQPTRRAGDSQFIREEFGRPWEEVAPTHPGNPNTLGEATQQIVTEGQGFRAGRNRVFPDEQALISGPVQIEPQSISLNATPGIAARAGSQALTDVSNSVGGGVFGAASGGAMPADSEEQRRQNMLTGAAIGMGAGPIAGRLMRQADGALATPGVSPNSMKPATPRQDRAAQVAGRIALTNAEEVKRLRLDKFPEAIRDDLLEAAQDANFGARLRRGVLSDDAVQTLAAEYAPSIEQAIAGSRRGRAYSAEEIIGLRNLLVNQAITVRELGEQLATRILPVDEHTAALARLTMEQQRYTQLAEVAFGGAPAEAGRALRQFRQIAQDLEQDPAGAGLRYLRQQFGTLDAAEEVAAKYQTMVAQGATPVQLADFLRSAKGGWLNRLSILRYSSMLSSTTTHLINGTGNLMMQGVDVATTPLAAGIDVVRSAATGAPRQVFMDELPARLHGMSAGARTGLADAVFIMQHGLRPEDVTKLDQLHQGFGTNIPGVAPVGSKAAATVDFLMEGPLRALSAADAVFRSTARGGHLAAEATAAAMKANGGKKAAADAIDQMMKDTKIIELADAKAARSVLQEQRQEIVAFQGFMRGLPPAAQQLVSGFIPFVRTPYNLVAQGVGMTPPAGLISLANDVRLGKPAREVEERLGRMAIGTAIMGVAAWDYMSGNLTGPRPEKETERSTLPPGWREWSRKVTLPNGETQYIPLATGGQLAIPAVVAILIGEGVKQGKGSTSPERAAEIALGMGQFAADQTFLKGVSDLAGIFDRGGSKIDNALENLASQFSPHVVGGGAIGRQLQQIMGMPARDPEGAIEALLATHPLTAGQVPVRRDVLGRPVKTAPGGVQTAIAPFRASVENDAPVIAAFRGAGEGLPMQAPDQVRDERMKRTVELSRDQQEIWRLTFGQELNREWTSAGQPKDARTLRQIEQKARDAAANAALGRR